MKKVFRIIFTMTLLFTYIGCGEKIEDIEEDESINNEEKIENIDICLEYGHWLYEEIMEEATCVKEGLVKIKCKNCEYQESKTINKVGHDVVINKGIESTCTIYGSSDSAYCSVCNEVFVSSIELPLKEHDMQEATCYEPEKCINCFYTQGTPLGCIYDNDECIRCGKKLETNENLNYDFNESLEYYTVMGPSSKEISEITIPSTYNGYPVIEVASRAFTECYELKKVIIEEGIEKIGYECFLKCTNLENVTFPASLKSVGHAAFFNCNMLESLYYNGKGENIAYIDYADVYSNPMHYATSLYAKGELLTGVTILEGVEKIKYQYYSIEHLSSIVMPTSVDEISEGALSGCSNLRYLTVPFIGNNRNDENGSIYYLFRNKDSNVVPETLYGVTITDCTFIPDEAFLNCTKIHYINLPDNLISIGKRACYNTEIQEMIFPTSLKIIDDYAFSHNQNLSQLFFNGGLEYLGEEAFSYCKLSGSLDDLYEVEVMGPRVFAECDRLDSYWSCGKVIGEEMFLNCDGLTSIYLSGDIKEFGSEPFKGCTNFNSVVLKGTLEDWCEINFYDEVSNPLSTVDNFIIDYDDGTAVFLKEITELVISEGATKIGSYAFANCNNLKKVIIPGTVKSIGDGAFFKCQWINTIKICEGVEHIGELSFSRNICATTLELPKSIKTIGINAFQSNLSIILSYNGTIESWCNISFGNQYSNPMSQSSAFNMLGENNEYYEVTEICIPDSITKLGAYQFFSFENLTKITIPESVDVVGKSVFDNCKNLVIYCDTLSKPDKWDEDWNPDMLIVDWGNDGKYSIRYYDGNSELEDLMTEIGEEEVIELVTLPNKKKAIFKGWFDNYELKGEPITRIDTGMKSDITLYAKWLRYYIVDDDFESIEGNISFNGSNYAIGVDAFASISEAIEASKGDAAIYVVEGKYKENFSIGYDYIGLYGINYNNEASLGDDRYEEAVIEGIITINPDIKNTTIQGFKFIGNSQILALESRYSGETSAPNYNHENFKFINNIVSVKPNNPNVDGFIQFEEGASKKSYSYNTQIINNTFEFVSENTSAKNMIWMDNNINLKMKNNTFTNISGNTIYIFDSELGLTGDDVQFTGNTFKNIKGSAIHVCWYGVTSSTSALYPNAMYYFDNNIFENVAGYAINLAGSSNVYAIELLSISSNQFIGTCDNIIYISKINSKCEYLIENNVFNNVPNNKYFSGIVSNSAPGTINISNNIYKDNGVILEEIDKSKFVSYFKLS